MSNLALPEENSLIFIRRLVAEKCEEYLDDDTIAAVYPSEIAATVWNEFIDPGDVAPPRAKTLGITELGDLARKELAGRQVARERNVEQMGLFQLQSRYPALRDGGDAYVILNDLTYSEFTANAARLRSEAKSKAAHADALEAERDRRVKSGQLRLPLGGAA